MTAPTAKKVPAKRVVPLAKAVRLVPEFAAALTEMANNLAAERFRADQAEAKLAEEDSALQAIIDGLRADILEINRILNWYGGQRGWCSDYETLQGLTNQRLTQSKLLRRPEYGSGHSQDEIMPDDPSWRALSW